jgi:hypothetical protein
MEKHSKFPGLIVVAVLSVACTQTAAQAVPASSEVPVSLVVTVIGHQGADISEVNSGNLIVSEGRDRAKITDVVPLQGARAGLELFIMMDNAREISYGTQVEDIRRFILARPPTTKIGVAYMDMEGPKIVQNLTVDHSLAAQALTTPLARLENGQSPYTSLSQLIDKWPASNNRREVLLISNGEDATFGNSTPDQENPYLDAAIEKAQRSGIVVFAIATSNEAVHLENEHPFIPQPQKSLASLGPGGAALGKLNLGRIAEGTGGEYYYYKSSAPISFAAYLADLTDRLASQYLVSFLSMPRKNSGLHAIKVRSELPHTEVVTAKKVYIPAPAGADR